MFAESALNRIANDIKDAGSAEVNIRTRNNLLSNAVNSFGGI